MKQRTSNLFQIFTAVLLVAAVALQGCSKKEVDPGTVNPGPAETETLKLIPDSMFRLYLKANICPNAFDATGKMIDITHSEVKNFTGTITIDSLTCPRPFVSSLKGIEYFSKMKKLVVVNTLVDSLKLAPSNTIDTIKLLVNKDIQYLDLSGCINMRYIRIVDIPVTSLDLSDLPALEYVNLINLARLNHLNTAGSGNLRHLMTVGLTAMQSVDVSTNTELRRLYLEYGYGINSINVTKNRKLYGLVGSFCTNLKSIDLSKNDSLSYLLLDDSDIDTIDFSNNRKLFSVAMMRTPLRNLDFRNNPGLKVLYLDGCTQLQHVDLRAQSSFDYWIPNLGDFANLSMDDRNQVLLHGYGSPVETPIYRINAQATRKGVNGATVDLYGGLRLPIYQDAGAISLVEVKAHDGIKDNYSFVMSRRVIGSTPAVKIKVYAADQTTVLCENYDPLLFKCN